MKKLIYFHLIASLASLAGASEIPVGTVSENRTFAVRSGSSFSSGEIHAYEGKILVLMMMTPWCPICQSQSRAVGTDVLAHYGAASRNALRGKNNQGVAVVSLLLSTEPASSWDNVNASFATTNHFQNWGIDAKTNRTDPRQALGYYRGGFIASSNLYDWGEDRRRVVVINLVRNSASHTFGQVIINQNSFSAADAPNARTLIDAVKAPAATVSFSQWKSNFTFGTNTDMPLDDADRDGVSNLLEFYHGSHPTQVGSLPPAVSLVRSASNPKFVYQRAKNLSGITILHQYSSNLKDWFPYLNTELTLTMRDLGATEEITVTLPVTSDPMRAYRLSVTSD